MKAVIVIPPVKDFYFTPQRASSLGAEAVKTVLENYGFKTSLINMPGLYKKPAKLLLPKELDYLRAFIVPNENGPISFFSKYYRFGPDNETCVNLILKQNPNIVFLSCFAWAYAEESIKLAEGIKKVSPDTKIAIGGAGLSVNPDFFNDKGFDFIISGEAEKVLPAFLEKEYKIFKESKFLKNQIGFYLSTVGESKKKNIRYISTILTRGCPKACRFCANHLVHGRDFRKTPLSLIEADIKNFPNDMNIHINFEDDNLLLDKKYFYSVLDIVKNYFPMASFSAENGLDYTLMDKLTTEKLIASGFKSFNLSMASTEEKILKQESRPASPGKLEQIVKIASKNGIPSTCYFICGLEADSKKSIAQNLVRLHLLPTLTGISLFYPVPGLQGFSAKRMSKFKPFLCAGSSAYPWTGSLSTKTMITAFRLSRLSNLIKTIDGRIPQNSCCNFYVDKIELLLEKIKQTQKLHTLSGKSIIEVPNQDFELVDYVLEEFYDSITKTNFCNGVIP